MNRTLDEMRELNLGHATTKSVGFNVKPKDPNIPDVGTVDIPLAYHPDALLAVKDHADVGGQT